MYNGIPDHLIEALGHWTAIFIIQTPSEVLMGISSQLACHHVLFALVGPIFSLQCMDISSKLSAAFCGSMLLCKAINGVAFTVSYTSWVSMFFICSAQLPHFTLIVTFQAPKEVVFWVGTTSKVAMDTSFLMLEHCLAPTTL